MLNSLWIFRGRAYRWGKRRDLISAAFWCSTDLLHAFSVWLINREAGGRGGEKERQCAYVRACMRVCECVCVCVCVCVLAPIALVHIAALVGRDRIATNGCNVAHTETRDRIATNGCNVAHTETTRDRIATNGCSVAHTETTKLSNTHHLKTE